MLRQTLSATGGRARSAGSRLARASSRCGLNQTVCPPRVCGAGRAHLPVRRCSLRPSTERASRSIFERRPLGDVIGGLPWEAEAGAELRSRSRRVPKRSASRASAAADLAHAPMVVSPPRVAGIEQKKKSPSPRQQSKFLWMRWNARAGTRSNVDLVADFLRGVAPARDSISVSPID